MNKDEFQNVEKVLGLDPKDNITICLKQMPILPTPDGVPAWNFISATYVGFEGNFVIIDTDVGREVVNFDEVLRLIKRSNIERARLKV